MQIENVASYITDWLTNYASKNHLKGFVIGISGGMIQQLLQLFVHVQDFRRFAWKCQYINHQVMFQDPKNTLISSHNIFQILPHIQLNSPLHLSPLNRPCIRLETIFI